MSSEEHIHTLRYLRWRSALAKRRFDALTAHSYWMLGHLWLAGGGAVT